MSKGTSRRPARVDAFELERRWNQTFGRGQVLSSVSPVDWSADRGEAHVERSVTGAATPTRTETAATEEHEREAVG